MINGKRNFSSWNDIFLFLIYALTEELESLVLTGLLEVGDDGGLCDAHTRWTMWYSSCCWG